MSDHQRVSIWFRRITLAFIVACIIVDVLPNYGPPEFRYTGSDPAREVWNIGWPLALAIYDSQTGIHFGPLIYLIIPVQILIALAMAAVFCFLRWHEQTNPPRTDRIVSSS